MNIALWIVQIIIAIKLVTAAISHGIPQSKLEMRQAIEKMGARYRFWHMLVTVFIFIAAVGLILPAILGWQPWLTAWAAVLTAVLMLGSIFFHVRYRDKPNVFVSVILFIFAAFVAYGRWALVPF